MRSILPIIALAALVGPSASGQAASLSVSPVAVYVMAPGSAATITVRNKGDRPTVVQFRAFRWTQDNGSEQLDPTRDVVVSPPIGIIAPSTEHVVRVVRVAKGNVVGEESYRLLIDEVPDATRKRNGTVSLVLRYSVPVFFTAQDARPPQVSWRMGRKAPLLLTAHNAGGKHLRIANLKLRGATGDPASLADGLVGYVLGGSTMRFTFTQQPLPAVPGNEAKLLGDSEEGPFDAAVIRDADN